MRADVMLIGPATRDLNIDYDGGQVRECGGAVTFCAFAARAAGAAVTALVKAAPEDRDVLGAVAESGAKVVLLPSRQTTLMRNEYFAPDRERRRSACLAQSDPVLPEELPEGEYTICHLAGLLSGDFPAALLEALARRGGALSADMQGFLRHSEGGGMALRDWPDKRQYLPLFRFLKADAAEAGVLTGLDDRREAARRLHAWGAGEILISFNEEMLVFDGQSFFTCPVRARGLSGRTGRGDTVFGAYLARRALGDAPGEALLFATAMVSLKMEAPGPFRGGEQAVRACIRERYADGAARG